MKSFSQKALICLITIELLLLPVISCSKSDSAAQQTIAKEETAIVQVNEVVKEMEVLTPVEQPEYKEGIITFFSGEVSIFDSGSWYDVEIGDFVTEKNSIKVASDSYCEVQFGETAVIKIQENSEIDLSVVSLKPGEANVNLDMKLGNVLCKVQKLASEETFKVKTQTAVCGVRGTEFSVATQQGKDTVLAVKEGAVTVLPKSVDVDQLKEKVADKGDEVLKAIEKIEQEAPVVKANEEIAINEKLVADTKKTAEKVETIVNEIAKEQAPAAKEESIKKLETAIVEQQKAVTKTVEPPKEMTVQNAENLKQINDMKLIAITMPAPVVAAETEAAQKSDVPPAPVIKLHKVSVESIVEDAFIEANGRLVGRSKFSGIYPEGELISFNINRSGYEPYILQFKVSESTARLYKIELKKLPEPEVPPRNISIRTIPADAEIIIDNQIAGKGTYNSSYKIGTDISFTVSKTGYASQTTNLKIDEKTPESIDLQAITSSSQARKKCLFLNQQQAQYIHKISLIPIPRICSEGILFLSMTDSFIPEIIHFF